jgi:hypothetical protein
MPDPPDFALVAARRRKVQASFEKIPFFCEFASVQSFVAAVQAIPAALD